MYTTLQTLPIYNYTSESVKSQIYIPYPTLTSFSHFYPIIIQRGLRKGHGLAGGSATRKIKFQCKKAKPLPLVVGLTSTICISL